MTKSSKKTAKNKNIAATIFKSNETIRTAAQICVSAVCLLMCFTIFKSGIAFYICAAVGYLSVFVNIFVSSIKNIVKGEIFDEFFLLVIASVGAILLGQYTEAVAVTLFFTIGEFFEKIATEKSKNTVKSLSAMIPDTVDVDFGGEYKTISAFDVKKGDVFRVTAGKRVPLDGIILSGESNLDASALTGESLPIFVKGGDTIKSGCIVADGELKVRASEIFLQSTVSKILQMTEEEQEKKSAPVAFITKFSKIYTPSVIGFAAIIAVFLPMILDVTYAESVYRALSFLVISCPCALVVSVPLSFFAGIGTAAKHG
ncbi:MAG: HAD-IC family P-type ATPase, partial [Clostridia bacterium]